MDKSNAGRRRRRTFDPAFKAELVAAIVLEKPKQPLPAPFVPVSVAPSPSPGEVIRLDITRGTATLRVQ